MSANQLDSTCSRSISAFDLIVITMVVALALFHYWRFQDAAASSADRGEVTA